jgi:hypothetical protein
VAGLLLEASEASSRMPPSSSARSWYVTRPLRPPPSPSPQKIPPLR